MTHDLLANVIDQLQASVASVLVTELRDNTFYAVLRLDAGGQEIRWTHGLRTPSPWRYAPTRPSSPRRTCWTPTASSSTRRSRTSRTIVREFKDFLEEVTPEDFSA